MKLIQYSLPIRETGNASGKAKKDAFVVAQRLGFSSSYYPSSIRIVRVIQQMISLPKFIGDKVIFVQYPAVNEVLLRMFKKTVTSDSYKIALIHDLTSIQGLTGLEKNKEAELLNIFDCIIVHNECMNDYVDSIGYKGKTVILELFDYLHDVKRPISNLPFSNSICFAGNLGKAKFLNNLDRVKCNWILYGNSGEDNLYNKANVVYKGLLPSDEIQYRMEGDYGLVWDGDSIESCEGPIGEYLLYNNPHKLSCYLAAGKPIITWSHAAIAQFVNKYHVGITVNSLEELNDIDLSTNYNEMRKNALEVKQELAKGMFLEKAIKACMRGGDK